MQKISQHIYYSIFIAILIVPILGLFIDLQLYPNCEKRELAKKPEFKFSKEYINQFEDYFDDHFGFRNLMIHLNGTIRYSMFNSSSKPQKAVIGTEGWFYYTSMSDKILNSYANKNLLSESELNYKFEIWSKRKALLIDRNIEYYMSVWPNKPTIYPEFVPFNMSIQKKDTISKIDQIISFLELKNSPVELIDVREELFSYKSIKKVYCKHDSHWNDLGAFIAYQKLMTKLNMVPYQLSDFDITWEETNKGGLIDVMGLCNSYMITDQQPVLKFKDNNISIEHITTDLDNMYCKRNNSSKSDKRILIFRDSYSSALVQFISLNFREAYFVWSDYHQFVVDMINPDIVVVAKVERYL